MAIKWNGTNLRSKRTKVIAFIVMIACLLAGSQIIASHVIFQREQQTKYPERRYYANASWTSSEENYAYSNLLEMLSTASNVATKESEENIRNPENYTFEDSKGESIPLESLEQLVKGDVFGKLSPEASFQEDPWITASSKLSGVSENINFSSPESFRTSFKSFVTSEILRFRLEKEQLESYNLTYYISGDTMRHDVSEHEIRQYKYRMEYSGELYDFYIDNEKTNRFGSLSGRIYFPDNTKIILATNAVEFAGERAIQKTENQQEAKMIIFVIVFGLVGLLSILVLGIGAGRRVGDTSGTVYMNSFDKIPLDLGLGGIFALTVAVLIALRKAYYLFDSISFNSMVRIVSLVATIFPCLLGILWFLSFAKHFKAGTWWKSTVIYRFFVGLGKFVRYLWNRFTSLDNKLLLFFALVVAVFTVTIVVFLPPTAVFFAVLLLLLLAMHLNNLGKLRKGVHLIEQGQYHHKIEVKNGTLAPVSRSIESISSNMDQAVAERMKSELYKTELITNVSHDIRTPLTSLITYTDLLKSKGLDNPDAPEYLDILIQKSNRLKQLTDDLFEATKAASGNIETTLEPLNLHELIKQSLGELDEKIEEANLKIMISSPEDAMVLADGKLMWRVLENLFSNVFKYSFKGTRVYVDVIEEESSFRLEIKNISSIPLNISGSELIQRFQRGDASRSSEGSGLGLSIVESFILAQKGSFQVTIDGDLFKAVVTLPKVIKPQ